MPAPPSQGGAKTQTKLKSNNSKQPDTTSTNANRSGPDENLFAASSDDSPDILSSIACFPEVSLYSKKVHIYLVKRINNLSGNHDSRFSRLILRDILVESKASRSSKMSPRKRICFMRVENLKSIGKQSRRSRSKNWFIAGSPAGASAITFWYSLLETVKANENDPYEFLLRKIGFSVSE